MKKSNQYQCSKLISSKLISLDLAILAGLGAVGQSEGKRKCLERVLGMARESIRELTRPG
jgi:hypothetical protein